MSRINTIGGRSAGLGVMRYRWGIFLGALVGCLSVVGQDGSTASPVEPRPNVIFMMADDHTSQAWGCYGGRLSPWARTPHIDRLAGEGARLTQTFCVNSICVPSRASILTGQYSHQNGVKTLRDALDPDRDHVAKRLRSAGYRTALVGKWHLKTAPRGFDYWNVIKGQGRYHNPVMYEMDWQASTVHQGRYSADVFTDLALAWLERHCTGEERERPFALMLHFKATHEPFQFPKRLAGLYEGVTFPEPETLFGPTGPENSRVPGWPLEILTQRMTSAGNHGDGRLVLTSEDPRDIRRQTYQKFIRDFLRAGAAIDENIGRVLEALEARGLAGRTVVIYTSDQGYFLGEHNYFDKRFMLEESLRMPMVVRYPPEIPAGSVIDDILLNIDFAPTLLDYAGQPAPKWMQGRSFRSNLRGETAADWRDAMYYRYWENSEPRPSHFGIRTRTHKLIYYDGIPNPVEERLRWELYDLAGDPEETRNVYDAVATEPWVAGLKGRLAELQRQFGDRP